MINKINLLFKNLLKNDWKLVAFVFIFAFLFRLYILLISDNFQGAIAADKVIFSMELLKAPFCRKYMVSDSLLHSYLIAGALRIWNNPLISPRLVGLIFGSILIFPYYFLVKSVSNKEIAFLSAILVAVYPYHVIQSTLTTAEVPFHFLLFSSLSFFFAFKKATKRKGPFLILSAMFLTLSCITRHEGWIFIPLLFLFLLNESLKHKILFIIISTICPVFIMYLNLIGFHNPLAFLINSDFYSNLEINYIKSQGVGVAMHYSSLLNKLLCWPLILWETALPLVTILGFLGLAFCIIKRQYLTLVLLFMVPYSILTYKIINETLLVQPRYALSLGLLMMPLSITGLEESVEFFRKFYKGRFKEIWKYILTVLFVVIVGYNSIKYATLNRPLLPQFVKELSLWLHNNAKKEDKILIDRDEWQLYSQNIILQSRLRPDNFKLAPQRIVNATRTLDTEEVLYYLKEQRPRYILICPDGYLLSRVFDFPPNKREVRKYDFMFRYLFQKGPYRVYEVL